MALFERSEAVAGWIVDPVGDEIFTTVRGRGARCNGLPLTCRQVDTLDEAVLAIGRVPIGKRAAHFRLLEKLTHAGADFRRLGSAALSLAYLAAGRIDAYYDAGLSLWDYAAGALLFAEGGGVVIQESNLALSTRERVPFFAAAHPLFVESVLTAGLDLTGPSS